MEESLSGEVRQVKFGPKCREVQAERAWGGAEMAFMFMERNAGKSTIDYPVGGSRAIVDALVRGIRAHGGRVLLRAPVQEILLEGARLRFWSWLSCLCF